MRKNDLIKLLSDINGNLEIVLWNGYTQDFMKVDRLVESDLVKMTKEAKQVPLCDWEGDIDHDGCNVKGRRVYLEDWGTLKVGGERCVASSLCTCGSVSECVDIRSV